MPFGLTDVRIPVVAAPMAGGPTTPELAAAVTNAGGLGMLPGALISAEVFAERIASARKLTSGPLGINLFAPQPSAAEPNALRDYATRLAADAQRYGVELGEAHYEDDGWASKLDVVLDTRPELASFTFSLPSADECRKVRDAGITTMAMVTTVDEALRAVGIGIDALVVQGPCAGGHRGVHDPVASPPTQPLADLLSAVLAAVDVPVVAAGGLATAADVAGVLRAGAVAAQVGTAFLLAEEAGTNPVHRAALQSSEFSETLVTRCFTGRFARGLRNRFTDRHHRDAPPGYPDVNHLTSPLRKAAVAAGDPQGTHLWAGTEYRKSMAAPAADIVEALAEG